MKEATGELNSTVIVVTAVGLLAAFFYTVIWPGLRNNMDHNTRCSDAWCEKCKDPSGCGVVTCHYESNGQQQDIQCPWKG